MFKNQKIDCCHAMLKAQERGTDNESYGPLVYQVGDNKFCMGTNLPTIGRCPWCGTKLKVIDA